MKQNSKIENLTLKYQHLEVVGNIYEEDSNERLY